MCSSLFRSNLITYFSKYTIILVKRNTWWNLEILLDWGIWKDYKAVPKTAESSCVVRGRGGSKRFQYMATLMVFFYFCKDVGRFLFFGNSKKYISCELNENEKSHVDWIKMRIYDFIFYCENSMYKQYFALDECNTLCFLITITF